jgi:hypothetical protein
MIADAARHAESQLANDGSIETQSFREIVGDVA